MAEPPATWDSLTASLAVADLQRPHAAWAFLAVQGLVRDAPSDRERFVRIVQEETPLQNTGPTLARRVAMRLENAGIALPPSRTPDPWAKLAAQRLALLESWTGGETATQYLQDLQEFPAAPATPVASTRRIQESSPKENAFAPRPQVWHCIYCGWRCDESFNDCLCKRCHQVRTVVGGSATVRQCETCGQVSLAIAAYCEWCGARFAS